MEGDVGEQVAALDGKKGTRREGGKVGGRRESTSAGDRWQ